MTEGVRNWRYAKGKAMAFECLAQNGFTVTKKKGGGHTVAGCVSWNATTGAWRFHDGKHEGTGIGSMMHYLRKANRLSSGQTQEAPVTPSPKAQGAPAHKAPPHPHIGKFQVRLVASRNLLDLGHSRGVGCAVTFTEGDVMVCDGYWDAKQLTDLLNHRAGEAVAAVEKVG